MTHQSNLHPPCGKDAWNLHVHHLTALAQHYHADYCKVRSGLAITVYRANRDHTFLIPTEVAWRILKTLAKAEEGVQ